MSKKAAGVSNHRRHFVSLSLRNHCFCEIYALFPKNAAAGLGKIFLCKIHICNLEALSIEVLQTACIGGEGEGQLVGIQGLVVPVKPFVQLAVFAVTQQGMTGMGKLSADLVGAACDQLAFYQTQPTGCSKRFIIGLAGLSTGLWFVGDENLIFLGILK